MEARARIEAEGRSDPTMEEMIQQAALAGAYWSLSREFPGHEGGFFKLAARSSERVAALADELVRENARLDGAPSPMPGARQPRA